MSSEAAWQRLLRGAWSWRPALILAIALYLLFERPSGASGGGGLLKGLLICTLGAVAAAELIVRIYGSRRAHQSGALDPREG